MALDVVGIPMLLCQIGVVLHSTIIKDIHKVHVRKDERNIHDSIESRGTDYQNNIDNETASRH